MYSLVVQLQRDSYNLNKTLTLYKRVKGLLWCLLSLMVHWMSLHILTSELLEQILLQVDIYIVDYTNVFIVYTYCIYVCIYVHLEDFVFVDDWEAINGTFIFLSSSDCSQ